MICCRTTLAGQCLGISQTNAFMATWLFTAATLLFDRYLLERGGG